MNREDLAAETLRMQVSFEGVITVKVMATTTSSTATPEAPQEHAQPEATQPEAADAPPPTDWMTPQEVAAESPRHHETVLAALRSGELRGAQPGARGHWTIKRSDFEQWMQRGAPAKAANRSRKRMRTV